MWDEGGTGEARSQASQDFWDQVNAAHRRMFDDAFFGRPPIDTVFTSGHVFGGDGRLPFMPPQRGLVQVPAEAAYGIALLRIWPGEARCERVAGEFAQAEVSARRAYAHMRNLARLRLTFSGYALAGIHDLNTGALVAWAVCYRGEVVRSWGWGMA